LEQARHGGHFVSGKEDQMGLLGGLAPLVLGIIACIGAYGLELGQWDSPGPGLWPFLLGVSLVICSLALLVKDIRKDSYEKFTRNSKLVVYTIISIAVSIVFFQALGVVIAVIALMFFQLRVVGSESYKICFLITTGMTAASYMIFSVWLKIPFPGWLS
jgi:putative tricarboxylic transport membrane protein